MIIDYPFEVHKLLSRKKTTISCVIPALNEGPRIANVLEVVVNFPVFDEIILVNDASTDNTRTIMEYFAKRNKKIKVINRKVNKGKTSCVIEGIDNTTSQIICLIDADITGLKYEYLYKMLYYLLTREFDMTILDRAGDRMAPIGWSHSWIARFNGGERAFWKTEYNKIKFAKNSKYGLEQELNLHFLNNGLKVRTIYCPELSGAYQFNKKGVIEGLKTYKDMFIELYKNSKVKGFYLQVENIVEDRLEQLYEFKEKTQIKKPIVGAIIATGLVSSIFTFLYLNAKNTIKKNRE